MKPHKNIFATIAVAVASAMFGFWPNAARASQIQSAREVRTKSIRAVSVETPLSFAESAGGLDSDIRYHSSHYSHSSHRSHSSHYSHRSGY